ncbi:asparagine synthase (glutamine-hydrolyzing) [Gammaproteobacteria bacterium]|nr:asparagine synthase (glutamine-hydrolyzing) [Gammaproteobacteria bacterium]
MCGIAGILGKDAKSNVIDDMLMVQHHRGPDFTDKWLEEDVALGHNRLSIIDLSNSANQPFFDKTKRYVIVFNGEIYNYIELRKKLKSSYNFQTTSDTEVLLAAFIFWGKDCLKHLNGMFSFAIYDTKSKSLFAARDRFGVKPFFYHKSNNSFYFSSEIKAIHAAGVKKIPNEEIWASYFVYGSYGMPDETFWEKIFQLPGGHYLEFKNNTLSITKWYVFEEEVKKFDERIPFNEVKEKYAALLKNSIELRFRADVSVGFNISGGLDSSALLVFVNQMEGKENINAYTFYTGHNDYDELYWVKEMINTTQNPLSKVLLTVDHFTKEIDFLTHIQDEPFGGIPTIAYSKIFKEARKDDVIVLLDGQGMDEQWAGYDYYLKNNDQLIQGMKGSPLKKNVLSKEFLSKAKKPFYPTPFDNELLNKQYRDLFYTKIPRALRFNDRVSMAYSTELREPFLDYRLVEFAFAQPYEYKIKNGIQKYLLRELVSEYLDDSITNSPKRPLQTPQREWLGNELSGYVESKIENLKDSDFSSWFDINEMSNEWQKYKDGDNDSSFHIWQWISLSNLIKK